MKIARVRIKGKYNARVILEDGSSILVPLAEAVVGADVGASPPVMTGRGKKHHLLKWSRKDLEDFAVALDDCLTRTAQKHHLNFKLIGGREEAYQFLFDRFTANPNVFNEWLYRARGLDEGLSSSVGYLCSSIRGVLFGDGVKSIRESTVEYDDVVAASSKEGCDRYDVMYDILYGAVECMLKAQLREIKGVGCYNTSTKAAKVRRFLFDSSIARFADKRAGLKVKPLTKFEVDRLYMTSAKAEKLVTRS